MVDVAIERSSRCSMQCFDQFLSQSYEQTAFSLFRYDSVASAAGGQLPVKLPRARQAQRGLYRQGGPMPELVVQCACTCYGTQTVKERKRRVTSTQPGLNVTLSGRTRKLFDLIDTEDIEHCCNSMKKVF